METKSINDADAIYLEVAKHIGDPDVRDLWNRLQSELVRPGGGPEACSTYLDGELTRMKEQVERSLDWLNDQRGGRR